MLVVEKFPTFKTETLVDPRSLKLGKPLLHLEPRDDQKAQERFDDWVQSAKSLCAEENLGGLLSDVALCEFLVAAFELSPYICGLANNFPTTIVSCWKEGFSTTLEQAIATTSSSQVESDEAALMSQIRTMKKQAALICGLADLGGWWDWKLVSHAISDTADNAVRTTIDHLLRQAHHEGKLNLPDIASPEKGSGYTVLAMGKHGARELNYSSDIDLIVLFDPDAIGIVDRDEAVKLFVRLTKRMIKILQERTADGYGFRTDLRLRPDPGSMPLAIPLPIAMNYYESRGQNWERAALIKARPVAGDIELGHEILAELSPFIWRRYLDFAAIADVHSIKRQIQSHRGYSDLSVPGHNVKLGRGGIREIEFFVQTQQLIAGGRNPNLRGMRTLDVLVELVQHEWIEDKTARELSISYAYLRDVEHRLQIVFDDQTHLIPEDAEELARIARLCGETSVKIFEAATLRHLENVEMHYSALFATEEVLTTEAGNLSFTGDEKDPGTIQTLIQLGFEHPDRVIDMVRGWHYGRYGAMQSEKAREQLTELTPALLAAIADTKSGDDTLLEFDEFLRGLPSGMQLFSVLLANKRLLNLLMLVLSAAPRLARIITRRPHIFDGVLEPGFFDMKPDIATWKHVLYRSLDQARDYEDGLDRVRIFAAEQKFLVGVRLLSGAITAKEAGELFSDLAEMLLLAMADWVHQDFQRQHGLVPGAHFAIVGMGNLGSRELTAGSDLDLILVYQFDPENDESNGSKKLHASQYYGRMAQRLIAAMSAPTSQGVVYELDFRLRPHGAAGPIATSLRALEKYYDESAWTWERLALTRARVLGDETPFSNDIEQAIFNAAQPRGDKCKIVDDVLDMRLLMDTERPAEDCWDIKLAKGGLVDLDFLNQTKQLLVSEIKADDQLMVSNPQEQDEDELLKIAREQYLSIIHYLRLCLEQEMPVGKAPSGLIELILSEMELPDLASAEGHLKQMQKAVRKLFLKRLKTLGS